MTKEQKMAWIENANNKELLAQYRRAIREEATYPTFSKEWCEAAEDVELCAAEILKRTEGWNNEKSNH